MDPLPPLTFEQCRVVGVLIEKALTTPDNYPLTLSAIVSGCNQKQNRDPVVALEEGDVARVLHELMLLDLVKLAPVGSGARSNRFAHHSEERLRWGRPEQAVMAELLIRGPQTVGELRTRASRMGPFNDLEGVTRVLDGLAAREPAHVRALPREPGRSAIRHTQLLGAAQDTRQADATRPAPLGAPSPANADSPALLERIARLETMVHSLEQQISDLRSHGDSDSSGLGPGT